MLHVPCAYVAAIAAVATVAGINTFQRRRVAARRSAGLCVRCGYDLTGNVSGVCPECGTRPSGSANENLQSNAEV